MLVCSKVIPNLLILVFFTCPHVFAQFNVLDRAKNKVERKLENKADKAIDDAIDEALGDSNNDDNNNRFI